MDNPYRLAFRHLGARTALATVTGLAYLEPADAVMAQLGARTQADGIDALLLDIRDVLGVFGIPEKAALAAMARKHMPHLGRLAWLTDSEKMPDVREGDPDCRPQMAVFSDEAEALRWLAARDG